MKNIINCSLVVISIILSQNLLAEESAVVSTDIQGDKEIAETEAKWVSNIEFGYVATSGNTDTTSINSGVSVIYEIEKWRHSLDLKSIFGSAKNATTEQIETNAERFSIEGKTDYKYSESSYGFFLINYEEDKFSDNNYLVSSSIGRGFVLDISDSSSLDLEVGVGYRQTEKKATVLLDEEVKSESIFRLAAHYLWEISDNSKFEQKISTDIGEDNSVTKSYTGLSANVADSLALKFSFTATHQSEVRGDIKELDTVSAFTLVYNF